MMRRLLVILLVVTVSQSAWAQATNMEKAPVVKRQIDWRSMRHQLVTRLGGTLTDVYFHNLLVSVGYNYHATNWFSVGANVGYAFPMASGLTDRIEDEKKALSGKSFAMPATSLGLMLDGHAAISPLYGKTLLFGKAAVAYDFYLQVGAGLMQVRWNSDLPGTFGAQDAYKTAIIGGGGLRLYLNKGVVFGLEVLDHIAMMQVVADRKVDPTVEATKTLEGYEIGSDELTHNIAFMVSVGVMLPFEMKFNDDD